MSFETILLFIYAFTQFGNEDSWAHLPNSRYVHPIQPAKGTGVLLAAPARKRVGCRGDDFGGLSCGLSNLQHPLEIQAHRQVEKGPDRERARHCGRVI